MGWDASAKIEIDWAANKIKDPVINKLFENAKRYVIRKAGCVDALLELGGLDCSACGKMLEKATNRSVYDEKGWSEEVVKTIKAEANWNFKYKPKPGHF